jgi:histone H3/H4
VLAWKASRVLRSVRRYCYNYCQKLSISVVGFRRLLREEVRRRKSSAKTLKDQMLAEMLEEMASAIEADSQCNEFVFARKL